MTLAALKPTHLKRYKDIIRLLMRYGQSDWLQLGGLDQAFIDEEMPPDEVVQGDPDELARDLEELGPTFVKLGQLLSTRPDLLPQPYLEALTRLQDEVEPFSYEEVEEIIWSELGVRISHAFLSFDPVPVAAASLGQVHRAQLPSGQAVAVKVQRPGIRQVILSDLETFNEIAALADQHTDMGRRYAFQNILTEFRKSLLRELDYRREAQNLIRMGQNLSDYERIIVPQPVGDYTTSRVLTMEYVLGTKITELGPLALMELDGLSLARDLCRAYLDHILIEGFFHADPHPGNMFITPDQRLAMIDFGMVAHLNSELQAKLLRLVVAISSGESVDVARLCVEIGTRLDDCDEEGFTRQVTDLVARFEGATIDDIKVGRVVMELARLAANHGIRPAPEITMVGKTLLHLDEIGRVLDPKFNPNDVIREHVHSIMTRHMLKSVTPGKLFSSALELNEFVQELPGRINKVLDALVTREFELKIQALDETRLMNNIQKVANRITMGLVLAALIVGAALIMRIDSAYTILGYPAVAIVLFLVAVGLGLALVFNIFMQDVWRKN